MKIYLLLLLLIFVGFSSQAQTFSKESPNSLEASSNMSKAVLQNLFQVGNFLNYSSPTPVPTRSVVFLNQIGSDNDATINTITNASDIEVRQQGNSNFIKLDYTVNSVVADVTQLGDNNRVVDQVYSPDIDVHFDLTQQGNNLTTEKYGTNSLTESLKFKQTGFNKTLIIRSFK